MRWGAGYSLPSAALTQGQYGIGRDTMSRPAARLAHTNRDKGPGKSVHVTGAGGVGRYLSGYLAVLARARLPAGVC
jgi:hypothetical protein